MPDPQVQFQEALAWVGSNTFWAPDVIRLPDGRFYFYYCVGRLDAPVAALGVAVSLPVLNNVASPDGAPAILLSGDPGRYYVVEASTNVGKWWPVCTNLTGLTGVFTNRFAVNPAWRYRARLAQ